MAHSSSTCCGGPSRTSRSGHTRRDGFSASICFRSASARCFTVMPPRRAAASPSSRAAFFPPGPQEPLVSPEQRKRWRTHVKSALATTISRSHELGLTEALARGPERPLILGYHRIVEDFAAKAKDEMPSMLTSAEMFERHLDLVGRHFRFVTLDEIGEHLTSGEP